AQAFFQRSGYGFAQRLGFGPQPLAQGCGIFGSQLRRQDQRGRVLGVWKCVQEWVGSGTVGSGGGRQATGLPKAGEHTSALFEEEAMELAVELLVQNGFSSHALGKMDWHRRGFFSESFRFGPLL